MQCSRDSNYYSSIVILTQQNTVHKILAKAIAIEGVDSIDSIIGCNNSYHYTIDHTNAHTNPRQASDHNANDVENLGYVGMTASLLVVTRRPGRVNLYIYTAIITMIIIIIIIILCLLP